MNNERQKAEQLAASIWPGIHLEKRLGKGAYGSVYECVKTDTSTSFTTREALKIIDMTFDDIESLAEEEGTTPDSYYQKRKKDAIDEIEIMYRLKSPHIVHINDYAIMEKENLEGFYILIRMDVLTSLANVMKEHVDDSQPEAEELAKKVALDICDALILCQKKNIVHRDIKPQNVFLSENGEFYLGDFGVAKSLSCHLSSLSYKGTELYIAPEVALGKYDHRVDLYSLGLLLYQLLNHRRMPFCPAYPKPQSAEDTQDAYIKRVVSREPVPAPDNCSPAFAKIVLKLCQYNPDNRYKDAAELKEAILALNQAKAEPQAAAEAPAPESSAPAVSQTPDSGAGTPKPFGASKNQNPLRNGFEAPQQSSAPVMDKPDTAPGNSGAFTGFPGFPAQEGSSAVPEKVSHAVPEPSVLLGEPGKKKMPLWALAAVTVVVVVAGALFFGKTVFAPKNEGGNTLSQSENADEPDASDSIDKTAPSYSGEGTKLTSLNITEGNGAEIKKDAVNSLGETFNEAVSILGWYEVPYARFYVADYERLVGNFSCPEEGVDSPSRFRLTIYLDDSIDSPVQTIDMSRSTASTPLDIDLSGADFITFQLENTEGTRTGLLLTDCFLYSDVSEPDITAQANDKGESTQDDNNSPGSEGTKLTSLNITENLGAEVKKDVSNTLGETFSEAIGVLGWYETPYVRFYVRDYVKFTGNFSCPEEGVDSLSRFRLTIYLDDSIDSPVQTIDMSRSTASTPLDIDLSGADFITFQLENTEGTRTGLLLTDCFVY